MFAATTGHSGDGAQKGVVVRSGGGVSWHRIISSYYIVDAIGYPIFIDFKSEPDLNNSGPPNRTIFPIVVQLVISGWVKITRR